MNSNLSAYVEELKKEVKHREAKEHAYRPALKRLLESLGDFHAINDAAHIKDVGAPDFIIKRDEMPIAFAEAKDIDVNLDTVEASEQMQRYLASLHNLILTDYIEFRHYYKGERQAVARLGERKDKELVVDEAGLKAVDALLGQFAVQMTPQANTPAELAEYMAGITRQITRLIELTLPDSESFKDQKQHLRKCSSPA